MPRKKNKYVNQAIALPLHERVKCSCGRFPIGLDKHGSPVCEFHNSFPTEKVKELDWSKVPEVTETIYGPACPYCGSNCCCNECLDKK